ncbi:hypothetical protein Pcinc_041461 [Petrolisthes cinctipes]|uniref:C-type lectin domain-containing protein n=1 Tax=Petrolisthes cinctipes TaxID=88211 RepID=A0AAE1EHS1_PETCI|nr:hypothetical protein Pcinc_041461 [Petrolisthes cinctipes]
MAENFYAAARQNCKNLGGDLYVPRDDFQGMKDYIMANLSGSTIVIVGAYDEEWLDGRRISEEHWAPNEPSRNQGPIDTFWIAAKFLDDYIDQSFVSICHKGISYP